MAAREIPEGLIPVDDFQDLSDLVPVDSVDSAGTGIARTFLSPVRAAAHLAGLPLTVIQQAGQADAIQELEELDERLPELRKKFPHLDLPERLSPEYRQKYLESLNQATEAFPAPGNALNFIEQETGIPVGSARTDVQKGLDLGFGVAFGAGGSALNQAGRGVLAAGGSQALQQAGVPEPIADLTAGGVALGVKTPSAKITSPQAIREAIASPTPSSPVGARALPSSIQPPRIPSEGPSLSGRASISESNPLSGISVPKNEGFVGIENRIGSQISPTKTRNSTQGGKQIKEEINALDDAEYKIVNEKYDLSRELNRNVEDIHPELVDAIEKRITSLEEVPDLSGPQKDLLRSQKKLLARLVLKGPNGEISGYRPISNQTLIDQATSLRQKVDFDFAHGNPTGIYRPAISELKQAAVRSANTKNPAASESLKDADASYAQWSDRFNNDYIRPFRDKTNKDYSKLYQRGLDLDEFGILNKVLQGSKKGRDLGREALRDLVHKKIGKFLKNPKEADLGELDTALRELEPFLSEEELQSIRSEVAREVAPNKTEAEQIKSEKQKIVEFITDAAEVLIGPNRQAAVLRLTKKKLKAALKSSAEKTLL